MRAVARAVWNRRGAKAGFVSCICTLANCASVQMQEIDEDRLRSEVVR